MTPKHKISLHTLVVHRQHESPVRGDAVTHVSLEDDGAGEFFALRQPDSTQNGVIRLAFEEWPAICEAVGMLRRESVAREVEE